jgi:transcriptional regulator with XRE-family HTH domain
MSLGERIRQLRKDRRWTLSDLSLRTELSVSYHSDIEKDRTDPSLKTLVKLADAFGLKVIEILYTVDLGETREPLPFEDTELWQIN